MIRIKMVWYSIDFMLLSILIAMDWHSCLESIFRLSAELIFPLSKIDISFKVRLKISNEKLIHMMQV